MAENGHQVFQYDGTIEAAPNSHPNMHFHRNNIASPSQNTPDTKTIGQIFDDLGHQGKDNIILQIDIEGAEWTVFEEISEEQIKQFKQIIIEWHHLSPFLDGFDRRLEILRKVAKPIHRFTSTPTTTAIRKRQNKVCLSTAMPMKSLMCARQILNLNRTKPFIPPHWMHRAIPTGLKFPSVHGKTKHLAV